MKVGDKLICKKHFETLSLDGELNIGKLYKVEDIEKGGYVRIKIGNITYVSFDLYENKFCGNIYDYFQSPEEIRKKKLDSI